MRVRHRMLFWLPLLMAAALVPMVISYAEKGFTQGFPVLLQITSPADGTVVNPGQTITVVVTPTSGDTFTRVGLSGEQPFGTILSQGGPPYQFSLTVPVPPNLKEARKYRITAFGGRSAQQSGKAQAIYLDVESAFPITKMWLSQTHVIFERKGQQFPLAAYGTFSDGSTMGITYSSRITYTTADTAVATVDSKGMITAVGKGIVAGTSILVKYEDQTVNVQVSTRDLPDPTP